MLQIYICDDDPTIRGQIEDVVRKQILIHGYDMEIAKIAGDPEEILKFASQGGVYFLDVELKGASLDGFELGRQIRMRDNGATIIYITAFGDLAFRTFQYHIEALDYIVKDNEEKMQASICCCLAELVQRLESQEKRGDREYYTIRFMDTLRQIPIDEIYYFETSPRAHKVILYTEKEILEFPGKLSEIQAALGARFFRSHRAFLVNLDQVEELLLKENTVIMKNQGRCLVARNMKSKLLGLLSE